MKVSALFEDDTNFSPYLRLNLTLILSRIIHCVLDSSLNLTPLQSDPRKLNPTDNLRLANEIVDEILADKKIKSEFLKKFYNLSLEEFQKEYEKLQAKLKSDMLYKENFRSFLQKLINTVYKITYTRSKKSKHSKIELGIIKDLANYNFNWEEIRKEKPCFYPEVIVIDNISKEDVVPYTTLQFVLDLKKEVSEILSRYISIETLSTEILNQKKSHIKSILEYSKKSLNYKLTGKLLTIWEAELKSNFDTNFNRLKRLIERYKKSNNILETRHWVLYNHPDLKLDYFKSIDTLEKAYWFGLLFADGSIYIQKTRKNKKMYKSYIIDLQLNVRDGILIKKFIKTIGFNPKHVEYQKKTKVDDETGEIKTIRTFRVRYGDKSFAKNMITNGYIVGKKANKIRLPKLANRKLYLAFLLGYFDGDGKKGTTRITTNSKLFLTDTKAHFVIKNKIDGYKYKIISGEQRTSYRLHLGADLFNEMLDTYENSLSRKRIRFLGSELSKKNASGARKFKLTRVELENLIWKVPKNKIVEFHKKRYGIKVSSGTITYWCNKWAIKTPPIGYFLNKKKS